MEIENQRAEEERYYQSFESLLNDSLPPDSPHRSDLTKEFISKPPAFQKGILKELFTRRGEATIPLVKHLLTQDEKLSEVIVDSLTQEGNESATLLLRRVAEEIDNKRIRKLVRKAFYYLTLKGVPCPHLKETEGPVFKKISLPKPEAYMSHIDGLGDRLIILAVPESLRFSVIYSFVINDLSGIKDLQEVLIKKKDLDSYLKGEDNQQPITMVDVDYPYAQYLLHLAYEKNTGKAAPLPPQFTTRHKALFHAVKDEKPPLIYRFLEREGIEQNQALVDYASDLFTTPEIRSWHVDEHFISEYRSKLEDLNMSQLIISKAIQEDRIISIIHEATRAFFTPEHRHVYKRRLEEMAYIFWKTNRQREAEKSLAVALCLISDTVPIENQVFPRELIRRSLFPSSGEKERERSGGIILPNSRVII